VVRIPQAGEACWLGIGNFVYLVRERGLVDQRQLVGLIEGFNQWLDFGKQRRDYRLSDSNFMYPVQERGR
jgi:hypothetical protein